MGTVADGKKLPLWHARYGQEVLDKVFDECERFARQSGYRRIRLWTQSTLLAARAIYAKAGYRLVGSEEHHSFGADLVGEVWELALA